MAFCGVNLPNNFLQQANPSLLVPEVGFDQLTESYVIETTNILDSVASDFAKGDEHASYNNMHVTNWDVSKTRGNLWSVAVQYKGLITEKPAKHSLRSYSQTYSGVFKTPASPTTAAQTTVSEPAVSATESIVIIGAPNTDDVGSEETLPFTVSTPPYIWSTIADPTLRWPDGWVLESRSAENIPETEVWFQTSEWIFYHPASPS